MQNNQPITLAVFQFEDLTPASDLGVYSRSFSEELIIELSRFRQLRVISFPWYSLNDNASGLVKDYFVQGTFRLEKDMVRINVQLYHHDTRHLVWGNRYEGILTDISEIQNNLIKGLVAVLQQKIDQDLLSKLKLRQIVAFNAYEHWLFGMEELKKASVDADLKAREYFEKAMQIQPDYALAYMGMSLSYFNEWSCQLWERWDVSKSGAYEWAQKAVEIDDQNHVIAMVLGRIFLYEGSYNTAEYYFRRSLMLNSNDPDTLFPIALYLVYLGLDKEALALYEKGLQLHPFFAGNHFRLGGVMYFEMGDYKKAASYDRN
ncbi:MAG: hypothetical protein HC905_14230 [Bacteroidales bacterium]|nr:hypothetical protein [Bacteroidales bacterium]